MLERLARSYDIRRLRWILVHTPFVEAEQVKRYKALNFDVTTTITFLFGTGDLFRRRFKPEFRDAVMSDLLPLRRFFDGDMTVAAGADWGPKNVFEQIQLALPTRRRLASAISDQLRLSAECKRCRCGRAMRRVCCNGTTSDRYRPAFMLTSSCCTATP
jgi:predicted amidohydrolase YtcJ